MSEKENRLVPNIDVAIQELGEVVTMIGRLRIAGTRLDGSYWGNAIVLLQNVIARLRGCYMDNSTSAASEGSKLNPGIDDCYTEALPHEPMFVLLARDASAPELVRLWAKQRKEKVDKKEKPVEDLDKVLRAYSIATKMELWRKNHEGEWSGEKKEAAVERK